MRRVCVNARDQFDVNRPVNPIEAAQRLARPELPKRFYKRVTVEAAPEGETVMLDGRPARTPARRPLALPSRALAEAAAEEWAAQENVIDPGSMPLTRLLNAGIDGVAKNPQSVADDILRYAASDLVCYRAEYPEGLLREQARHWDPLVAWIRENFGVRLTATAGVMHVAQAEDALAALRGVLDSLDVWRLAALHAMTTLTGSAVIALGVLNSRLVPEAAWEAAHVDEDWNIRQWGQDAEAMRRRARRFDEMKAAARVANLLDA
jgi:chaperone required for assembly of F1-ATPase